MTLSCTAYQVENLFSPPAITWIAPDGSEVSTVESSNRHSDPETGELIFSDVTSNNNGRYTCRAVINIPEAQIDNYYDEATVQVHANGEWLVKFMIIMSYIYIDSDNLPHYMYSHSSWYCSKLGLCSKLFSICALLLLGSTYTTGQRGGHDQLSTESEQTRA